jgi:ribosomal protein S18 acetylase RimI-like enzyme
MTVSCRPARPDDVEGICTVRIRAWQQGYRGTVPQDFLDSLTVEAEVARWRSRIAEAGLLPGNSVAVRDGVVVGWSSVGRYRADEDGDEVAGGPAPGPDAGEINAIYVLPERWGAGIGRALMAYSMDRLAADGLSPALLWVLRDNARARRFYERYGFRLDGASHTYEVGGAVLPEVRYRFG